jgi:hypothetical protein
MYRVNFSASLNLVSKFLIDSKFDICVDFFFFVKSVTDVMTKMFLMA